MQVDIHAKVLGHVQPEVASPPTAPVVAAVAEEKNQQPSSNDNDSVAKAVSLVMTGLVMFALAVYQYVIKGVFLPLVARIAPMVPKSIQDRAQSVLSSKGVQKAVHVVQTNIRTYTNIQI